MKKLMQSYDQLIDLHIHSSFSDGAFTPEQLVTMALQRNIITMAIADHDSISGIDEAIQAGTGNGIGILPAVELSVQFESMQDVHLLGYGINYRDERFLNRLNGFRDRREKRNEEILERINQILISEDRQPIALDEVLRFAQDAIGRPHIARALLERSYAESLEDAFRRYLVPCNVPKAYWPIDDAIQEIRRIGGVAVLAHPTTITRDHAELRRIILTLQQIGLQGVEVYNNQVYPDDMEFLRRLSDEAGLLITAGSDFHGIEEGLEMGRGRGGIGFKPDLLTPLYDLLTKQRQGCC